MLIRLAIQSLRYRKGSVALTIATMSLSIFVMLGVEHMRLQAKSSFASSVSGVDLIVGARTSSLQLLLYSVFRMGEPTKNISWQSYQYIAKNSSVRWAVPISLGDSHQGFRVMGTTPNYFDYFKFGSKQSLHFEQGHKFEGIFDVVLGSHVARSLNYKLGDKLVLSHGIANTSFKKHGNLPFKVVGILAATGTPVDQALHVSLQGLEAVHVTNPLKVKRLLETPNLALSNGNELSPKSITAVMLGLNTKMAVFNVQRHINTNNKEPLIAILPGVALSQLWQSMRIFDNTLRFITIFVFVSALMGLGATLLSSIRERRHEIELLRIIGAPKRYIFFLIQLEAIFIALFSTVVSLTVLSVALSLFQGYILNHYGIAINAQAITNTNPFMICGVFLFTFVAATPSALAAFKAAKVS